ncbi:hypothetical protein Aperf_G00000098506 [Anoplocephala perfoliata]
MGKARFLYPQELSILLLNPHTAPVVENLKHCFKRLLKGKLRNPGPTNLDQTTLKGQVMQATTYFSFEKLPQKRHSACRGMQSGSNHLQGEIRGVEIEVMKPKCYWDRVIDAGEESRKPVLELLPFHASNADFSSSKNLILLKLRSQAAKYPYEKEEFIAVKIEMDVCKVSTQQVQHITILFNRSFLQLSPTLQLSSFDSTGHQMLGHRKGLAIYNQC